MNHGQEKRNLNQEFVSLILLLQQISPAQFKGLCQLVQNEGEYSFDWRTQLIQQLQEIFSTIPADEIERMILFSTTQQGEPEREAVLRDLGELAERYHVKPQDLEHSIVPLVAIHQLRSLLQSLSIVQIMKFFEIIPTSPQSLLHQLQILQQLQKLFSVMQPEMLTSLYKRIEEVPGSEQRLDQLLNLPHEFFQLYQPLRILFQMGLDDLIQLRNIMPNLPAFQVLQLLQLLQLQPFDVLEVRNILVGEENDNDDYNVEYVEIFLNTNQI
jgi:hypothetical protein